MVHIDFHYFYRFLSSGCSPKSFINDDILPGFASAISEIVLLSPIVKVPQHFQVLRIYYHTLDKTKSSEFTVISFPLSGCLPIIFGSEHKYFAFSKLI